MTTQIETVYESAKETAKKIRVALKANFPGVKFSVTSKVYSGGDNVNVSWTDLPLKEEVEKVVNQFKSGSFNGMEDIYETSGYMMDGKRYVGAKYIFCTRSLSEERKQEIKNWMTANYAEVNENTFEYNRQFNQAEVKMMTEQATKVEVVEVKEEVIENKSTITKEENVNVEMNLNESLNGVELKFSGVPSEATRQLLKENGFKWSKYNKVWYSKQSTKTIMFAEALVSAYNETIEEVEEIPALEQNETVEAQEMALTLTEKAANDGILLNNSDLIGRKVLGNWGAMHSNDYGTITGETIYNEVIIKWEDSENNLNEQYFNIENLVFVNEYTNMNPVGIYLMPIENNDPVEVVTTQPIETPVNDNKITFINSHTLEDEKQPTNENKQPGKVLDFSSKFKQKQVQKETEEMKDHFLQNVLPYMEPEEIADLQTAYKSNDETKLNQIWQKLMLITAVRRATDEIQKQN